MVANMSDEDKLAANNAVDAAKVAYQSFQVQAEQFKKANEAFK